MQQELNDHAFMAEALRLANKGMYTVRTNPRVGCVIVKNNKIIGKGYHVEQGQEHAEVIAINSSVESVENSTVYLTLEPCSHHGNTPPCTDALITAKISRVVIAMQDPNPLVNGNGISALQEKGIDVTVGVLGSDALEINKGFVKRVTKNKPYITVKTAISMDGKTALSTGDSKWITSEEARLDVQRLRAKSCVILTGIETVLNDDPSLNVRLTAEELGISKDIKQPIRAIVDTNLRVPATAKILNLPGRVIVYTCSNEKGKLSKVEKDNLEIVVTKQKENYVDLENILTHLADSGINEVLVEAGPTLVGKMIENKFLDEMIIYIAPCIMGDTGRGIAKIPPILKMEDRIELETIDRKVIGKEIKVILKPKI